MVMAGRRRPTTSPHVVSQQGSRGPSPGADVLARLTARAPEPVTRPRDQTRAEDSNGPPRASTVRTERRPGLAVGEKDSGRSPCTRGRPARAGVSASQTPLRASRSLVVAIRMSDWRLAAAIVQVDEGHSRHMELPHGNWHGEASTVWLGHSRRRMWSGTQGLLPLPSNRGRSAGRDFDMPSVRGRW
jgi:hypothetical protein